MKYRIILTLVIISLLFTNQAFAFFPLQPGTIIIQNVQSSTNSSKQGTINQTLANNVVINTGGYKLNFINGSGNPVNILNSNGGKEINVTISSSGGPGGGVTSLNALSGALNIACVSGNTTCSTSGGNTITINTAWNVVTTGLSPQTITKQLTLNSLILGGQMNLNGQTVLNTGTITFPTATGTLLETNGDGSGLVNIVTSVSGAGSVSVSSSTGAVIITGTNSAQITNAQSSGNTLFGSRSNGTSNSIKTLIAGTNISMVNNSTSVTISAASGTDTNTAQVTNLFSSGGTGLGLQVTRTNATNNTLRSIICGSGMSCSNNSTTTRINSTALTSAITSINGDTTAAQLIKANSANSNITITDSGATHKIGIGSSVIVRNGTAQSFAKNLDFGYNSDVFNGTAIKIRNNAGTFTTTIKGSTQLSNQTIVLPTTIESETFAVVPQANFTGPFNQTGNSALNSPKVVGGTSGTSPLITITPQVTGRLEIQINGQACNSVANDGIRLSVLGSTTYLGKNGASEPAGTGITGGIMRFNATAVAGDCVPFGTTVVKTGLTLGTKYFIDMSQSALTGGTIYLKNVIAFVREY